MPIFSISQSFSTKSNLLQNENNTAASCNGMKNTRMNQSPINLVDVNYGKMLVKNNISFGSKITAPATDLSKKIAAALQMLKFDEIVIVGKTFEDGKKGLNDSLIAVPNVLNKIYFIAEEKLKTPFAIFKDNKNLEEILNFGADGAVQVKTTDKHKIVSVGAHSSRFITDGDEIFANGINFNYFDKDSYPADDMNAIKKHFITELDLSSFQKEAVQKLNSRKITQIDSKEMEIGAKKVKFEDVIGQDEAIEQIKEHIVRRMKYPNFYKHIKFGKNALFIGPPGTGKTLGARACANELDIPFFYINPQLLEDMFVGNSGKNIRAFYQDIRKNSPCLVFFDEVDAPFGKRNGLNPHREESLNLHLEEISKLESDNIDAFLLAATNKPERIDPAMLRDGRFGTKIEFNLPSVQGCKDLLKAYSKEFILDGVDLDKLSEKMHKEKFSGANIAGLLSDTALASGKRRGISALMDADTFDDSDVNFKHILTQEDFDKTMKTKTVEVRELIDKYEQERKQELVDEYVLRFQAQEAAKKIIEKNGETRPKIGYNR